MSAQSIDSSVLRRSLSLRDLTDAALGPHAMQLLIRDAIAALCRAWQCDVVLHRAPPVVNVQDNYDALGYAPEAAARDARYTRYLDSARVLRTQTSAMIPGVLPVIATAEYEDVLVACPGLTYRRDAIDRLHVGEPHQLDLWRVSTRPLGHEALQEMIATVGRALLPAAELRLERAVHPYTQDGLEVHACVDDRWVEILECGMAHPALLARAGLPTGASGLAMGIGLDRVLMLRKGIEDIRLLRSSDPRIARQMLDLEPYQPVSMQPAIHRDLSIAVAAESTPEALGDRVREIMAERSASIEAIHVLSETSYLELSVAARRRLGIAPGQKNVLLRLVIRDLERTLTAAEANEVRDEIYAALHEGSVKMWAAKEMQL